MIDGGTRGEAFRKAMKRIPMEPSAIQLIVVTHGHLDHMDGLKESKS
jgi:metal-dependent hydrolase (beta-lactamase superfamily II)